MKAMLTLGLIALLFPACSPASAQNSLAKPSAPSVSLHSPSPNLSTSPSRTLASPSPKPNAEEKTTTTSAQADTSAKNRKTIAGKIIVIDPGHNGGNQKNRRAINRKVPDGRGGYKACNTTGTAGKGYPEHAFNFAVAQRVKTLLQAQGAQVFMTRNNDTTVGPCVDERGKFGEKVNADAVISIHANGSNNTRINGFFAMIASPALNASQGEPSRRLAQNLIAGLRSQGFKLHSQHRSGLWQRADIAGLNWASRPAVMLELGEMRNPKDLAQMKSAAGRERYAQGIVAGLQQWAKH